MAFLHLIGNCFCCTYANKIPKKIPPVNFEDKLQIVSFSNAEKVLDFKNKTNRIIKALSSSEILRLSDSDIEENSNSQDCFTANTGCLPFKNDLKPTLVLDLDNTLIYSTTKEPVYSDHKITINYNGRYQSVWIIERPYLQSFLNEMHSKYELVLFTAGIRQYGIKVLKEIDKLGRIEYFLDRRFCRSIGKNLRNQDLFSKDLKILGRKIEKTILVDDRSYSFCFDPENGVLIPVFNGDRNDRCLIKLTEYLAYCSSLDDIRFRESFEQFKDD